MKHIYAFAILLLGIVQANAQCPVINAAMVNSCGVNEGVNEFIVFTTTAIAPVSDYSLYYGSNSTPSSSPTGRLFGSNAMPKTGTGTITVGSGCTLHEVTSPSTSIPSGSVVVFIPADFDANYDLAGLCSGGGVYVAYINRISNTNWSDGGTLANNPPANRYIQITNGSNQCTSEIRSFNSSWPANADGNIVFWNPGSGVSYQNNGCSIIAQTVSISTNSPVSVCQGTTSTSFSFTATGSPDKYSLTWSAAALAQGFTNVSLANLGASSISITVPAGAAPGSYTASLVATNSGPGINSTAQTVTVNVLSAPVITDISGTANLCVGSNATFTNTTAGGTWSSNNTTVATVSSTGTVTPLTPGNATISYAVTNTCGTTTKTFAVTVATPPTVANISGTANLCVGSNSTFTNTTAGGTWSSNNTTVATVSSTGTVTPVTPGNATISYTVTTSCGSVAKTFDIVVGTTPTVANITGVVNLCVGSNATFTNSTPGGTWSSSNTAVATVSSTGAVTPVAPGNTTINYALTNSCGTTTRTFAIVVAVPPTVANITGTSNICLGNTYNFTNTTAGGTWSSNNTTVATVSSTGTVTPVTIGTAIISYTVNNGCGSAVKDFAVTVTDKPTLTTDITSTGTTVPVGGTLQLSNPTPGGIWVTNNTAIAMIDGTGLITGMVPGTVTINYSIINSCGSTIKSITLTVVASPGIFIPNVFTPNGDGKNDFFQVYGTNIQTLDLKVFNQWGELIFATKEVAGKWNGTCKGKMQPTGVYIYAAKITLLDGTELTRKGSVNIVR